MDDERDPGESQHEPEQTGPAQEPLIDQTILSSESATPPRARSAKSTGLIVVVALALLAAGTAVALRSSSPSPALASLVPDDAAAYLHISLRPSVGQQQALRALLDRVPRGRELVGDRIDRALSDALRSTGLEYAKDVKPWLGADIALGARAPLSAGSEPEIVGLIAVKDEGAARTALQRATARADGPKAVEVTGGVAYVANSAGAISAFKTAAARAALADSDAYKRALADAGGGDGLALAYVDGSKAKGLSGGSLGPSFLGSSPLVGAAGTGAVVLRAERTGLVLAGHSSGAAGNKTATGTPDLLESSPAEMLGSITMFDLGAIIDAALKGMGAAGPSAQAEGFVQQALGLDLRKDILPWMHGETSILVGGMSAPPIPDVAILVESTDEAALSRTLAALRARLDGFGLRVTPRSDGFRVHAAQGFDVIVRRTARALVIASNEGYAGRALSGGSASLGSDSVYRSVFTGDASGTAFQLYVRVDRVRSLLDSLLPGEAGAGYRRDTAPLLEPFQTLAIRASTKNGASDFRLVLAVGGK